jgi:L-lysine 6-transaminase
MPEENNPGSPDSVPGPRAAAMIDELSRYVIADVQPVVVDLARSEGMWLMTVDGQKIFDWAGYYASKLLGHNHPGLYEPRYLAQLARAANNKVANPDFLTAECLDYYRTLHRLAPRCMRNPKLEVYAVNSGAEAVENMMKYFINLHHQRTGGQVQKGEKLRFLYFEKAFHGRTIFALNVTQTLDPVATKDFHGIIPGNIQVPFPGINTSEAPEKNRARTDEVLQTIAKFLERYAGEVVGMVVEPIQGAGGHRVAEPEFFQGLSRLAHKHGIFLGLDEVQTAGGPTGDMFMADQMNLPHPPQAVAVAKKFGCGAVYMLYPMEDKGVLDSTWGGPLVDMVRFVQELKIVERENLVAQAKINGEMLAAGLRELEKKFPHLVFNVRGVGLYQGFSLKTPELKNRLVDTALQQEHLLLLPAGAFSIRLRPNLSVTPQDIEHLLRLLERCLKHL